MQPIRIKNKGNPVYIRRNHTQPSHCEPRVCPIDCGGNCIVLYNDRNLVGYSMETKRKRRITSMSDGFSMKR